MITFDKVEIGYLKTLIRIDQVALQKGQVYALIGANGAGKSTLMKSIYGNLPLRNGTIELNGRELSQMTIEEKAKNIAFVDAHFKGIDFLTIQDYVALGRTPYTNFMGELSKSDLIKTHEAILTVGLLHKLNESTIQLSDGERQLSSVARALAQTPQLLLLDEPTAFLDYGNRKKLIQTFNFICWQYWRWSRIA